MIDAAMASELRFVAKELNDLLKQAIDSGLKIEVGIGHSEDRRVPFVRIIKVQREL